MISKLTITNTLSNKKELFSSLKKNSVLLYVCGITPYDFAHIGHARVYVTFDILYRLLKNLGYEVTYCRNFTDIDDKLLNKAQKELGDATQYHKLADKYINAYHEDMKKLNCISPTHEPRVTKHIPEIIEFIQALIDKGYAYVSNGNVYFSIAKFKGYGKLSKRDLKDLIAGARVDIREEKENSLDFALWKSSNENEVGWQSPWGKGRPGWHIECSVLAEKYLDKEIDIHAGGMDLIFPHHENEIAQSESRFNAPFSRYWMHNAFVKLEKEKMSKSLGNIINLRDIFSNFHPDVIRYYLLTHHYRAPLDFAQQDVEAAQKGYKRLISLFEHERNIKSIEFQNNKIAQNMLDFICDDLNTPGMLGVVFENYKTLQENESERSDAYFILHNILGLNLQPLPEEVIEITPEIQKLIDEREQARKEKNWIRADEIRDQLRTMGIEIHDK